MRSSWRAYKPATEAASAAECARVSPGISVRILGLDPGSLRTGFGIIDCRAGTMRVVAQGCIATAGGPLAGRLRIIHARVTELIAEHLPNEIAIERVFLSKSVDSALKLGHARGAALAAVPQALGVHEYAPRSVKQAVVGAPGSAAHRRRGRCAGRGHLPCQFPPPT
jgi:crossover junction endodeoxyribonuclease RuvC